MSDIVTLLPELLRGAGWTLVLSGAGAVGAVVVGIIVCAGRMSRSSILSRPAAVYVGIIRGTPLLLQLFYLYYALPDIGITMPALLAGILGLSLNFGGYIAEVFRGGVQSLSRGQFEASAALGLRSWQMFRLVIAPQTLRAILPTLANYAIVLVLDSSLVSVISVLELLRSGELLAEATFQALLIYTIVAAFYFIICSILARFFAFSERKLAIPGAELLKL